LRRSGFPSKCPRFEGNPALFIAVVAYRKVAVERRTVFELEVLRDLLPLAAGGPGSDVPSDGAR
jgi:hypothetical protein